LQYQNSLKPDRLLGRLGDVEGLAETEQGHGIEKHLPLFLCHLAAHEFGQHLGFTRAGDDGGFIP
jgi:hypothetical protein